MPNWTREQNEAINIEGKNIIVSAGAGSGKTAVLSERVLRKVMSGVDIDKLLILTFTNAAALEMKERIRKKLKEKDLFDQVNKLDSSYITTFDAYALSIVKKYNYLINISKDVSICEASIVKLKKKEIIDRIFEKKYKENNIDFLNMIDDFCTKDDIEIKEYILSINNKLDMIYKKEEFLKNYLVNFYDEKFINKRIKDYEDLLISKLGQINKELINLEEYAEIEYIEKVHMGLDELLISNNYKSIKSNITKIPNLPKNSCEELKESKSKISDLLSELSSLTEYEDTLEIKKIIMGTEKYASIIIEVINEFDLIINKYKFENDLYEFADIAKLAIKILEENEFVRNELKYNEILIDEYQDTNDLQDLFISFIGDNNVYMVGDIKQSIYRFRNANPNLFKSKYDDYSLEKGGIKIDLNKNFRSRKEVLNNINLVFDLIMDDKLGGAFYKNTHRMIYGNESYSNSGNLDQNSNFEIYNYLPSKEFKKEEMEIFIIANDIKEKIDSHYKIFDKDKLEIRNASYSDFVILMDRATNFDLYKKIFEFMGIPLTVFQEESINESDDLFIIKNIINLIVKNEKNFKYSFMSVLRSYLFRLDDEQIFNYVTNNDFKYLDSYINIDINEITPFELLEYIIKKFEFYEKIITVGNIDSHLATIDYLFKLSNNLTEMGYTVIDFCNYLEEIIKEKIDIKYSISNEENNSVKIMTIHKSKGLEYHICYYSGLYAKFNLSDLKEKFVFDKNLGIITPVIDRGIRKTIYNDLLKDNYLNEEISEKIRLFYVALTRAKEKMIIVAPLSDSSVTIDEVVDYDYRIGYRSFLDILNSIKNRISIYTKNIDLNDIYITSDYNLIKKQNYKENIKIVDEKIIINSINIVNKDISIKHFSKENHKLYSKDDYKNIEYGNYIHNVLENIDFKNPDYSRVDDFVRDKISNFLSNDIFLNVLNIYKEYEFIFVDENIEYHGIIDLMLEYQDQIKIVDYKLKNINDESYIKQLKGYKKYIESLTNKETKIYLYSIIDEKLYEIK